jgi:hypothetical protein
MNIEGPNSNIDTFTDYYDDFNLGVIDYDNWLQTPSQTAPPFLWQISTDPPSPFGNESVDFNLKFSKPMNTAFIPSATLQLDGEPTPPVYDLTADLVWDGTGQAVSATFDFDETIPSGTYRLFVKGGEDFDEMPSPDDSNFTFVVDTIGGAGTMVPDGAFNEGCVRLTWDPSTSTKLLGYNVYRSETPGGAYEQINFAPVTEPRYTDCSIVEGTTYYYVYTAVNKAYDESAISDEISVKTGLSAGFSGSEWTMYE